MGQHAKSAHSDKAEVTGRRKQEREWPEQEEEVFLSHIFLSITWQILTL